MTVLRYSHPVLLTLILVLPGAPAQERESPEKRYLEAHYTKQEYRIPMRDGVHLFTIVYAPKDTSRPHPILLNRTPYGIGPYEKDQYRGNLGPNRLFPKESYI